MIVNLRVGLDIGHLKPRDIKTIMMKYCLK